MQFQNATQAVAVAIRSIFDRWTALRLVVEHQLGGSKVEATQLLDATVAMATSPSKRHDVDDYINMFYAMFDRTNTDIEDGSPEQVAALILQVRDAAARGDFTLATQLAQKAGITAEPFSTSVQGRDHSDDEQSDPDFVPTPADVHYQPSQAPSQPIVDDQGFTQVLPHRKRR